jgi:hypothetical protein
VPAENGATVPAESDDTVPARTENDDSTLEHTKDDDTVPERAENDDTVPTRTDDDDTVPDLFRRNIRRKRRRSESKSNIWPNRSAEEKGTHGDDSSSVQAAESNSDVINPHSEYDWTFSVDTSAPEEASGAFETETTSTLEAVPMTNTTSDETDATSSNSSPMFAETEATEADFSTMVEAVEPEGRRLGAPSSGADVIAEDDVAMSSTEEEHSANAEQQHNSRLSLEATVHGDEQRTQQPTSCTPCTPAQLEFRLRLLRRKYPRLPHSTYVDLPWSDAKDRCNRIYCSETEKLLAQYARAQEYPCTLVLDAEFLRTTFLAVCLLSKHTSDLLFLVTYF